MFKNVIMNRYKNSQQIKELNWKKIIFTSVGGVAIVWLALPLFVIFFILLQFELQSRGFEICKFRGGEIFVADGPAAGARECHLGDESYNEYDSWDRQYEQYFVIPDYVDPKQLEQFDEYVEAITKPVEKDRFCYEYNVSTQFNEIAPKYVVAELQRVEFKGFFGLPELFFSGKHKGTNIVYPQLKERDLGDFELGEFYRIDMLDVCKYNLIMVDSRSPSPIIDTMSIPEKISG